MTQSYPAELGEVIRGYCLEEIVSRGGMGCVYKAKHTALGRVAAVKVLDTYLARDAEYAARFLSEARIVNEVRHANIVDIFDFVQTTDPPRVACVMEFIEGPTLKSLIDRGGLDVFQTVNVIRQVISALRMVHAQGVIHRDLKPANIMVVGNVSGDLDEIPSIKILDFGIAKLSETQAYETGPGAMLGTPAYMSPEQITSDPISTATDIYALGELLYEMMTGQRTFNGLAKDVLKQKLLGVPPQLSMPEHVPNPQLLESIVLACLAQDPAKRPTIDMLSQKIERYADAVLGAASAGASALTENAEAVTASELLTEGPSNPKPAQIDIPTMRIDDTTPSPPPAMTLAKELTPGLKELTPVRITKPAEEGAAGGEVEVRRLGQYTIFEELPSRGMTQLFVARRDGQIEICVLKRLLRSLEDDQIAASRFKREALIASKLNHPHLAKMMGASIEEGTFCIASEFIIGMTLESVIERLRAEGRQFPLQVFGPLFLRVLAGLHHAHDARDETGRSLGIVHRDLTPGAVVLGFSGDIKIRDFGIAKASIDDFRTSPGRAVGTLEYMSPEQAKSGQIDRRSDIYTIGSVMYEALSGRPMIQEDGLLETLRVIASGRVEPLRTVRPDLDAGLCAVIDRALALDPDQRFETAAAFSVALAQSLGAFSRASADVVGDFIRGLAPDAEASAIALMDRIRQIGELLPTERPPSLVEPAAMLDETFSPPEEPEPSVMTMPGLVLPPNPTHTVSVADPRVSTAPKPAPSAPPRAPSLVPVAAPLQNRPSSKRNALLAGGLAISALSLGLITFLVSPERTQAPLEIQPADRVETPPNSPTSPSSPRVSVTPVQKTAVPKEPAPEKPEKPDPTKRPTKRVEPTKKRPTKVSKTKPRPANTPPKQPPPPTLPPKPRALYRDIEAMLGRLQASPKDVALFDQVHARMSKELSRLPAGARAKVKIHLDSAERTYRVEHLKKALNRMILERLKT